MGDAEYGGNGSVHYTAYFKKDQNHGQGQHPHRYKEVDKDDTPGDFVVQVFNVEERDGQYDARTKTWTIRAEVHHGDYIEQIRITWPPDDSDPLST